MFHTPATVHSQLLQDDLREISEVVIYLYWFLKMQFGWTLNTKQFRKWIKKVTHHHSTQWLHVECSQDNVKLCTHCLCHSFPLLNMQCNNVCMTWMQFLNISSILIRNWLPSSDHVIILSPRNGLSWRPRLCLYELYSALH